jgi:hypothetical protein
MQIIHTVLKEEKEIKINLEYSIVLENDYFTIISIEIVEPKSIGIIVVKDDYPYK